MKLQRAVARRVQCGNGAASCGQKQANMNRITRRAPIQATGKAKQLFELLQTELGVVANVFHFLGVSAAKASWLRQECQQAMLVHIYNGSAQMDLYAGERYLQTIKRKIVHPGLPSNTAVSP